MTGSLGRTDELSLVGFQSPTEEINYRNFNLEEPSLIVVPDSRRDHLYFTLRERESPMEQAVEMTGERIVRPISRTISPT